ncbi:TPA: hypothetical protein RQN23_002897 [Aeromonas veronii]|nr:hypothetical protein [Aeromonas veronii]
MEGKSKIYLAVVGSITLINLVLLVWLSFSGLTAQLNQASNQVVSSVVPYLDNYKELKSIGASADRPIWESAAGRDAAVKIGQSARLSDIASYLMTSASRQSLSANDYSIINIASKQIALDRDMSLAMASLASQGFQLEVVKTETGYRLRDLWNLDTKSGSPFEKMFPTGARLVLHAESLPMPVCKAGNRPVLLYGLLYKDKHPSVPVTVQEEQGKWRMFIDSKTPYDYRVLADAGCVSDQAKLDATNPGDDKPADKQHESTGNTGADVQPSSPVSGASES